MADEIGKQPGVGTSVPPPGASGGIGDQATQAGATIADHFSELASDAKQRGASLAGELKDRAASAAQGHKADLADKLDDVAQAVHRSGEQLEGHQAWIAGLVERGADELGSLASTLRSNDLKDLLGGLQDLARRQPAVFVGASMAAGFALARIGKVAASGVSRDDLPKMPEATRERE